jgi:hypothetical protein
MVESCHYLEFVKFIKERETKWNLVKKLDYFDQKRDK